ncbi:hypothetical protein [Agreia sp. Leaf283]|uniref:hypothetical protein n=1 Tax=Agreia sp. Leaf283 TaxID=1736321 RepID=UPI0006FB1FD0|nr:hypothetical protein [Agreia sp. Leaf283]KQP57545.1 hypothetical protein ASF51_06935 [Agreia sp. Leaf283]
MMPSVFTRSNHPAATGRILGLFPRRSRAPIVHRSTWTDDDAYRHAVAAFHSAHGRSPKIDSRFPSERRLALWMLSASASTPTTRPRRFGTRL